MPETRDFGGTHFQFFAVNRTRPCSEIIGRTFPKIAISPDVRCFSPFFERMREIELAEISCTPHMSGLKLINLPLKISERISVRRYNKNKKNFFFLGILALFNFRLKGLGVRVHRQSTMQMKDLGELI